MSSHILQIDNASASAQCYLCSTIIWSNNPQILSGASPIYEYRDSRRNLKGCGCIFCKYVSRNC